MTSDPPMLEPGRIHLHDEDRIFKMRDGWTKAPVRIDSLWPDTWRLLIPKGET